MVKSRIFSALGLVLVIVIICISFSYRFEWWAFIDVFCFFMAAFLHLLATMQPPALRPAAHRIDFIAMILAFAGIIAFLSEAIAYYFLY